MAHATANDAEGPPPSHSYSLDAAVARPLSPLPSTQQHPLLSISFLPPVVVVAGVRGPTPNSSNNNNTTAAAAAAAAATAVTACRNTFTGTPTCMKNSSTGSSKSSSTCTNYGSVGAPSSSVPNETHTLPPPTHTTTNRNRTNNATATIRSGIVSTVCSSSSSGSGNIPHSIAAAVAIGCVCGLAATLYYAALELALTLVWKTGPAWWFGSSEKTLTTGTGAVGGEDVPVDWTLWLWTIALGGAGCATAVGATVRYWGDPGDLAATIATVHNTPNNNNAHDTTTTAEPYIPLSHVGPMVAASMASIVGGGSLGPEAPLVAICAAVAGGLSRGVLSSRRNCDPDRNAAANTEQQQKEWEEWQRLRNNTLRKHTLMGMTSALAAFFGCPLGGSLFALEVCSRFGLEYYEHALEAILASEVCLAVFRYTSGLPIAPIWDITETKLASSNALHIVYGVGLGLVGAAIAFAFARIHKNVVMRQFRVWNLLDNDNAIPRAWLGASVILCVGMIIPHTLFWGEYEFQTIATMSPASTLPHAFPAKSIVGFEMHNFTTCLLVGLAKLVCISFTVAGGYRGGYIFPLFSAAAAFGRAIYFVIPVCPVQLCVLCMAAALNVAITRTALGSTLILAYLAGEPSAMAAILAASLTSLFATAYMPPFIATQIPRADLEHSLHTSTAMYQLSLSLGGAAAASLSNTGGHGKHDFLEDSDDSLSGKTEALTPFLEDHKHQIGDNHYADCSSALLV